MKSNVVQAYKNTYHLTVEPDWLKTAVAAGKK
jgi:hypothetical protein